MPSPALITEALIQPESARRWAAPDAPCLITTASAPIACKVCAVSFNDSPLLTLEPFAEKLMTSADNRFAADSNEMRVLVESSKKRLTTVRPRNVGSFFIGPSEIFDNSLAVFSIPKASAEVKSSIESRWRFIYLPRLKFLRYLNHQFQIIAP
ncbi:unannotated protein [freshwater metagenome]|uniref:Unannotated protein n=1 Tax=freshwater metagenome TaxID=449393 RepID=A0A6J6BW46_9ZZZZ